MQGTAALSLYALKRYNEALPHAKEYLALCSRKYGAGSKKTASAQDMLRKIMQKADKPAYNPLLMHPDWKK